MFKQIHFFAFVFSVAVALPAAAQVPAYVPTDGLVGWWPFCGNANDGSGNGHDGNVFETALTQDRFGNSESAYSFDGINDYIQVPHHPDLNSLPFSISFWMKSDGQTGFAKLFNKAAFWNGWDIQVNGVNGAQGEWHYEYYHAACQGIYQTYCSPVPFPSYDTHDNMWHHGVFTVDSLAARAYWDGNLILEQAWDGPPTAPSTTLPMEMGRYGLENFAFYHGLIDDVGIWSNALTEAEVLALFNSQEGGCAIMDCPQTCTPLPSNLQQGLVGYWPFCGNANDESGNGNDGVVNGATLTEDRFGNAGAAYDFSADGAAIQTALEQSESPASSSDFTMSFWVRRDNSTILNSLLITYKTGDIGSANTSNFDIVHSHGFCPETGGIAVQNYPFNNPSSCSPDTLLNNEWYHIITHYKTVEGTFDVFKNGNFWFNGNLGSVIPGAGILTFGNNDVMDFPTQGQLDDIGIWNRALTPEEVQELYTLDACTFTVYDTVTVYETVYDTVYTYETIYDTVTTYISVTDTLLIDITFTGFEGQPSWLNTVTVFPNPASDHITIDYGNFALMAGYNTIITDAAGATVYEGPVNGQQTTIDINAWGATGVYYMMIYDATGVMVAVRQIVLE